MALLILDSLFCRVQDEIVNSGSFKKILWCTLNSNMRHSVRKYKEFFTLICNTIGSCIVGQIFASGQEAKTKLLSFSPFIACGPR